MTDTVQDVRLPEGYTLERAAGRWHLKRPDGRSSGFHNRHDAVDQAWREKDRVTTSIRKCMTCRCEFPSEGPHNRMCGHCRRYGSALVAV